MVVQSIAVAVIHKWESLGVGDECSGYQSVHLQLAAVEFDIAVT